MSHSHHNDTDKDSDEFRIETHEIFDKGEFTNLGKDGKNLRGHLHDSCHGTDLGHLHSRKTTAIPEEFNNENSALLSIKTKSPEELEKLKE